MPNEPAARLLQPPSDNTAEQDYEALHSTLCASARGRTFLAEYLRRNRGGETELLLGAIDRLAALVRAALAPADRATNKSPEPASSVCPHLSVVRPSEPSELPTPAPGRPPQPAMTLINPAASVSKLTPPSDAPLTTGKRQSQIQGMPRPNAATPAAPDPKSLPDGSEPSVSPTNASPSSDLLKTIMALSEEERIALFM